LESNVVRAGKFERTIHSDNVRPFAREACFARAPAGDLKRRPARCRCEKLEI
jgi:hypothetical protein